MPKKLAADLADRLEAEISRHTDGIAAKSLFQGFAQEASPRSLARILARLVRHNRVRVQGEGPATRYLPPPPVQGTGNLVAAPATVRGEGEIYVPLAADAEQLRNWVRRPLTQRRPVGYDRTLLERYVPNKTYYLDDASWRARLLGLGRAQFAPRDAGTYTRLDTLNLIEHSREAEGKDRLETQMILNHKAAIEFLVEEAEGIGFNMYTFMNLHALLSENLLADPSASGRLRTRIVEIGGTVYRPLAVPQQIEELFRMILDKAGGVRDPFEQAFFLMVHIPYLQPFADVNKRVSRLAANIPFIKANLCPLSFVDVPERAYVEGTLAIYEHGKTELLRDVFVWAYQRSCEQFKAVAGSLPEPDPFRLKYRAEIADAVAQIVRKGAPIFPEEIRAVSAGIVPAEARQRFDDMVLADLRHLHEGNLARYRLRIAEYRAWKEMQD